jgi:hypothetical protein
MSYVKRKEVHMKVVLLLVLCSCFIGGFAVIEAPHLFTKEASSWTCPICGKTFESPVVHDCIPG